MQLKSDKVNEIKINKNYAILPKIIKSNKQVSTRRKYLQYIRDDGLITLKFFKKYFQKLRGDTGSINK